MMHSSAQTGTYSSLVIRQTITGMSFSMTVQIIHYLGNGIEKDYTKSKDGVKFDEIIDVLNELKNQGWKVVSKSVHTNLVSDDVKAGMSPKNTNYIDYLLYKD